MLGRGSDMGDSRMDAAEAFMRLERVLDRIRRGEIRATEAEQARLMDALDALRALQHAA